MPEPIAHLLPLESSTPLECALSVIDGERLALSSPVRLIDVLDPQTCPAQFLPALAFELSVEEEWDLARTERQQRDLLSNAYSLNAKKGTPFAIKRGLAVIGFPGVTLVEGFPALKHDGFIAKRNGRHSYNSRARWALFDVRVPLVDGQDFDDVERLRVLRGIEIWQRTCCYLRALRVAAVLQAARDGDADAAFKAHVGLRLQARRDTPRDGRDRRSAVQRYRYDGAHAHDGIVLRNGRVLPYTGLRFGPQQVAPRYRVHLRASQARPPSLHFDHAILRDGTYRRDHNGAVERLRAAITGFGGISIVARLAPPRAGDRAYDGRHAHDGSLILGAAPRAQGAFSAQRVLRRDGTILRGGPGYAGSVARDGSTRHGGPTYAGRIVTRVPHTPMDFAPAFAGSFA